MKNFKNILFCVLVQLICFNTTYAQKNRSNSNDKKIETEEALRTCEGVNAADMPRIAVGSFAVTKVKAKNEVGEELASMLMNALQETKCFQVLESAKNMDDLIDEIDISNSAYSNSDRAPQMGKMMGAQLVISGEITEFNTAKTGAFGIGMQTAHVGFILKIVDPQERNIVWSKSVDRKVTKPELKVLGANLAVFGSRAMGDAIEEAVKEAVDLTLDNKPLFEEYQEKREQEYETIRSHFVLNVINADYSKVSKLEKFVKSINGVEFLKKSLKDGQGQVILKFDGTPDELADKLMSNSPLRISIKGLEGNYIDLEMQ